MSSFHFQTMGTLKRSDSEPSLSARKRPKLSRCSSDMSLLESKQKNHQLYLFLRKESEHLLTETSFPPLSVPFPTWRG